ncbi:hypothetical protein AT302_21460 [Pandoraea norimbergensis]|uniref:Uncharacterized protein n=1 Tax=Pandoraea norimbergensis TaxID=93219 RepID=A0ABN4JIE5_9BURK|nr:hypothetical protein AT302_13845 [Pandoraea norimbergensis]ALS61964.1 hypothetical protein AT302_21460 [Pandoraea norimbergensis]
MEHGIATSHTAFVTPPTLAGSVQQRANRRLSITDNAKLRFIATLRIEHLIDDPITHVTQGTCCTVGDSQSIGQAGVEHPADALFDLR